MVARTYEVPLHLWKGLIVGAHPWVDSSEEAAFFRASVEIKLCLRQSRESPLLWSSLLMVGEKIVQNEAWVAVRAAEEFRESRRHCRTRKQCWWQFRHSSRQCLCPNSSPELSYWGWAWCTWFAALKTVFPQCLVCVYCCARGSRTPRHTPAWPPAGKGLPGDVLGFYSGNEDISSLIRHCLELCPN